MLESIIEENGLATIDQSGFMPSRAAFNIHQETYKILLTPMRNIANTSSNDMFRLEPLYRESPHQSPTRPLKQRSMMWLRQPTPVALQVEIIM
jgi:hypothetical protein